MARAKEVLRLGYMCLFGHFGFWLTLGLNVEIENLWNFASVTAILTGVLAAALSSIPFFWALKKCLSNLEHKSYRRFFYGARSLFLVPWIIWLVAMAGEKSLLPGLTWQETLWTSLIWMVEQSILCAVVIFYLHPLLEEKEETGLECGDSVKHSV